MRYPTLFRDQLRARDLICAYASVVSRSAQPVVDFVVHSDQTLAAGGFLKLRRINMSNLYADGTTSTSYTCDFMVRPYGQDAVAVVVWCEQAGQPRVLLRTGLRPSLKFGRDATRAPLPEAAATGWSREIVAGILENHDTGEHGLRSRAAAEVHEEAGYTVDPNAIILLGGGTHPAPGNSVEKVYYAAAQVSSELLHSPQGDGSPMEDGATLEWIDLSVALAHCQSGSLCDSKTEIGLRRFADYYAELRNRTQR